MAIVSLVKWGVSTYQVQNEENEIDISYPIDAVKELQELLALPASKEWDDYRNRYSWRPVLSSDIDTFFAIKSSTKYHNGEREVLLQPYIMKTEHQMRAIPNEVDLYWRTDKNQQFEGRVFFNWEKTDAILKEQGLEKNDIRFHINKDNNIEVFLNDTPLPVQSIRVYKSNVKFQI